MTPLKKPSGQTWARFAYDFREKAEKLEKENLELKEALRWYVENDDTNEGGKWEVSNAAWLAGKRRAMKLLGMPFEEL